MIVVELVFLGAALEAVGEVGGGVARHFAAVQVEALTEPEIDELLDQRQVDAAGLADIAREAGFRAAAGRCARGCGAMPLSPTNM